MLTQADKLKRARDIFPTLETATQSTEVARLFVNRATDISNIEAGVVRPFIDGFVEVGQAYKKGQLVTYQGEVYRIGQDHTSQAQWKPGDEGTTALYSHILLDNEGNEIWQTYDGVSGQYVYGQKVRDPDDGLLYISTYEGANVWGPPHTKPSYWKLEGEEV